MSVVSDLYQMRLERSISDLPFEWVFTVGRKLNTISSHNHRWIGSAHLFIDEKVELLQSKKKDSTKDLLHRVRKLKAKTPTPSPSIATNQIYGTASSPFGNASPCSFIWLAHEASPGVFKFNRITGKFPSPIKPPNCEGSTGIIKQANSFTNFQTILSVESVRPWKTEGRIKRRNSLHSNRVSKKNPEPQLKRTHSLTPKTSFTKETLAVETDSWFPKIAFECNEHRSRKIRKSAKLVNWRCSTRNWKHWH